MESHEFPGNGLLPPGRPVWLLSTRPNNTQTPKGAFWGTGGLYLGIVHLRHTPHPADIYTAAPQPQRVRFRSFLSSVEHTHRMATSTPLLAPLTGRGRHPWSLAGHPGRSQKGHLGGGWQLSLEVLGGGGSTRFPKARGKGEVFAAFGWSRILVQLHR